MESVCPTGMAFAHSKPGAPSEEWHALEEHLKSTATLAAEFARAFGAEQWGHLAGLWHDLGKYAPDWQAFLREAGEDANTDADDDEELQARRRSHGPPHSAVGSLHAREKLGPLSLPLQFAIAAHHGGLPDKTSLDSRLATDEERRRQEVSTSAVPKEILSPSGPLDRPPFLASAERTEERNRQLETFIRMVFSTLVDADFLDTEAFFERGVPAGESRSELRLGWPALRNYEPCLRAHLDQLRSRAAPSRVNDWRDRVLGCAPRGGVD